MYIRRISAHISTENAESICLNRDFKYVTDHKHHTRYEKDVIVPTEEDIAVPSKIYEIKLNENIDGHFFGGYETLRSMYKKHF